MATCVPGWFAAQSCRMTISDYIAALVARAGVRNALVSGHTRGPFLTTVGSPHSIRLMTVCRLL